MDTPASPDQLSTLFPEIMIRDRLNFARGAAKTNNNKKKISCTERKPHTKQFRKKIWKLVQLIEKSVKAAAAGAHGEISKSGSLLHLVEAGRNCGNAQRSL